MESFEKPVVYTCVVGGYSSITPPPKQLEQQFEFLLFTTDGAECEGWRSVKIDPPRDLSDRRVAKKPKIQPWKFFNAPISIWIDANMSINVECFLTAYLQFLDTESSFGLCKHNKRTNLEQEFSDVLHRLKDDPVLISEQYSHYRTKKNCGAVSLFHGGILMRRHQNQDIRDFMKAWQLHIDSYSVRDQLSLAFLLDHYSLNDVLVFEQSISDLVQQRPHKKFTSDYRGMRFTHKVKWLANVSLYKILTSKIIREARAHWKRIF